MKAWMLYSRLISVGNYDTKSFTLHVTDLKDANRLYWKFRNRQIWNLPDYKPAKFFLYDVNGLIVWKHAHDFRNNQWNEQFINQK